MYIIIAGASGFIGSALRQELENQGHRVKCLVRGGGGPGHWDPEKGTLHLSDLEGCDAIINLAGENITGRWTDKKKQKILESRVKSTRLLSEAVSKMQKPPAVFINASAIGYYGYDFDQEAATEETPSGHGYLAEVCREWEAAAAPVLQTKTRLVFVRIGLVLSPKGGALAKMLPPFKLGLGGRLGTGMQVMSWITLEDLVRVFIFCLTQTSIQGPVNAVSPHPITNQEFTEILGKALNRPTFFPVPAFLLRLLLGEAADELLLASTRVAPEKLLRAGFVFQSPDFQPEF